MSPTPSTLPRTSLVETLKSLAKPAFLTATSALLVLVVLFAVSLANTFVDKDTYKTRARQAMSEGVLIEKGFLPLARGSEPYRYSQNDCLILSMLATDAPGTRLQAAISPSTPNTATPPEFQPAGIGSTRVEPRAVAVARGTPQFAHCFRLKEALSPLSSEPAYYHRYVHGYWVLAGALMALMSFSSLTTLLASIAVLIPTVMIGVCLFRARTGDAARPVAFAAMGLAYLVCSGVTLYAWSIDLACAEIILSGFLLWCFLRPLPEQSLSKLAFTVGLFGTLCASFEFLTALIPSALVLLFGLLALDQKDGSLKRPALTVVFFCASAIMTLAVKTAIVAMLWSNEETGAAASQLIEHTRPGNWQMGAEANAALGKLGIAPDQIRDSRIFAFVFAMGKLAYFSDLTGLGSRAFGLLTAVVGPAILVALSLKALHRPCFGLSRTAAVLLLASASVILVWVFVLIGHTIMNASWMQRMLPWLSILFCGIVARQVSTQKLSQH